jgi:hypothetical protein
MKRTMIWLSATFLLLTQMTLAFNPPPIQWKRTFQSWDTMCIWIEKTSDKGFIAAGRLIVNKEQADCDMYLLKMDSLGNTLWQRSYSCGVTHDWANFVQQTSDGGYVLAGGGGGCSTDTTKVIILKTDSLGRQQWKFRKFGNTNISNADQTADGGYISAGLVPRGDSLFLLKLDSMGNQAWRKTYNESYGQWNLNIPVHQTSDGGYIVAAEVLLKTDSLGNQLWRRKYTNPDVLVFFSVQETQDNGFVATGIASVILPQGELKMFNMVLLKTDALGNLKWKKVFTTGQESDGRCVRLTNDGGFVVSGSITINNIDHAYVVRTDSLGNIIWTKTLDERTLLECGQQTSDGGFIFGSGDIDIWKFYPEQ